MIPEIDESLLDNFDISKNTSDTGIDNLTTAYDQGGELFLDDTEIESQEEEFIEEATEANEEVQVEEVQQEAKVEAVVEAQLSTNTSFLENSISEDTLIGKSLGKIEVEYTGADVVRFALGGPGSENFEIDKSGNISLKQELDYETKQSYNLLVFTFLGEKSITNKLDLNVIDVDEEPLINLNILASSLSEDTLTNTKFAEIEVQDPEKNGITMSVSGTDKDKVTVSDSGNIVLSQNLDYEKRRELDFVVDVFDGKNTVSTPIKIKIDNVNDLTASVNLSNNLVHEGTNVNSVIGKIDVNGDNSLSYSLGGNKSNDFIISSNGEIKVNNSLDFSSKDSYELTLSVQGQNDAISIPLKINIAKNIDPDFTTVCANSCSQDESIATGTVIINSSRLDNDTDLVSYSLENNFENKFSIDSKTGEVRLSDPLDFESVASYNIKVIAEDSKGITKEITSTFSVTDVEVPERTLDQFNSNFIGNKRLFAEPSDEQGRFYLPDDLSSKEESQRELFDLNQGNLPSGTTYSVSVEDNSKYEVDSSGIVSIKSGVILNSDVSQEVSGQNLIDYLAGASGAISEKDHESFEDKANFIVNIPNEPSQNVELKVVPKKVESQENVVMKFASGYSNVSHNKSNPFKAFASRGDGTAKDYNSSVALYGGTITESSLSSSQLEGSAKLNSVILKDDGSSAYYAASDEENTFYRTNTVANGVNENDTNTLDFEYWFPVNSASGSSNTGSEKTKGQYAPLSVANADWDGVMHNNEKAKYGCYDSGQGCGNGSHELALSGSMVRTTEDPFFTGYKVIQSNIPIGTDTLSNSDMNGDNAGNALDGGGGSFNNIIAQGAALSGGSIGHKIEDPNYAEFIQIITLPENFAYFGNEFSHVYVNENGFLTFGNGGNLTDLPWYDHQFTSDMRNAPPNAGGGRVLSYLDDLGSYSNSPTYSYSYKYQDGLITPDLYGKPGTSFEGNLNNSIFALWADYFNDGTDTTCGDGGCNDFSIRSLWHEPSKILTIGWYNMKTQPLTKDNAEANFEIQLNFNTNEFKIVHGKFGNEFPSNANNNVFVGFSKDVACSSLGEDISGCEGKDYVQLYFIDEYFGAYESPSNAIGAMHTFQDPNKDNSPAHINTMYNGYFDRNQTVNGTEYCFDSGTAAATFGASAACSSSYGWEEVRGSNSHKQLTRAVPLFSSDSVENIFLPSNIKQSYRVGFEAEFMWMHLNKPSTTLTYNPPETNATGFELEGANQNNNITGGSLNKGSSVSTTTFADEIIIGGEVYKDSQLKSFLNNTKKVVAFSPIPVLHTNKYEMSQTPASSDKRFKHVHTIMPQFISDEFMEDKNNGTDLRFDFHQLADHDYSKSGNHLRYGTEGGNSFDLQNQFASSHSEDDMDGLYGFASDVLSKKISSKRFSGEISGEEFNIPEGQSLWQQVFNPEGRGAGIFVQMNWSCGAGGAAKCNEDTSLRVDGPHKTQQSLLSVLIAEVGDKVFFEEGPLGSNQERYSGLNSGQVMQGEHYWSYKRRSARTTQSDGDFAFIDTSPQLTFGISPIACVSGKDNGCFFGDNQSFDSNLSGAPSTAIISTDDPCHASSVSGCLNDMDLGIMHSMSETTDPTNPEYKVGTFYQGIVQQKQKDANNNLVDAINLEGSNSWRSGQTNTSNTWSGMMTGLFMTDTNNDLNPHPQYLRANTTTTFDNSNDRVMVEQTSLSIYSNPSDQLNSNDWYHSSGTFIGKNANLANINNQVGFKFGGANSSVKQPYYGNNQWAPSAYLNKDVFGAMLEGQNVGRTDKAFRSNGDISSSVNTDNAGALVTWNTIDEKDRDFMNDSSKEPSLEYMTWGVWGMAISDSQLDLPGYQASAVHMGTWFAGDLLDVSDWPISRTATLAGMAMFDVFARIEESGITNSFHWTEGAGATGSVVFDGTGNYDIDITVANLGTENCPSSYCGSGFVPGSMAKGSPGSITWSANGVAGQASFELALTESTSGSTLASKQMWGELYGKGNHVEAGALLQYSLQSSNEMIMYSGTAILSE